MKPGVDGIIVKDRVELLKGIFPKNAVCAEVGVNQGAFSKLIFRESRPKRLHLIDIWSGIGACGADAATDKEMHGNMANVADQFVEPIKQGLVCLHQGLSHVVLQSFAREYFDWIYLDADHSFDGLLRDLYSVAMAGVVKEGGLIAGHDFGRPEDMPNIVHKFPGVYAAVMVFCRETRWKLVCFTECHEPSGEDPDGVNGPSFVLRRG
jgi:hypothetical protein